MWKKNVCRQLRINKGNALELGLKVSICRKMTGQIEMVMGLFAVFLVVLIMFVCLKISYFMITGAYVEDALAASNLASALIDIEEYGKNHTIRIADPQEAYGIYKEALSVNLQLDEDGRSFQRELLEGPIKIKSYIIYNVKDDQVEILAFTDTGTLQEVMSGEVGQIYTPDGVMVETTTIYSKISFGVKGLGQQYIQVEKEKSVDVKRNEDENGGYRTK